MDINIAMGKNEGYLPSSVGGRSISGGWHAGSETKILQFDNFNSLSSKAKLNCLNRSMVLIAWLGRKRFMAHLKDMLL